MATVEQGKTSKGEYPSPGTWIPFDDVTEAFRSTYIDELSQKRQLFGKIRALALRRGQQLDTPAQTRGESIPIDVIIESAGLNKSALLRSYPNNLAHGVREALFNMSRRLSPRPPYQQPHIPRSQIKADDRHIIAAAVLDGLGMKSLDLTSTQISDIRAAFASRDIGDFDPNKV